MIGVPARTRAGRGLGRVAGLVLAVAAVGAAYLSWGSLYAAVAQSDIGQHSPVIVVQGVPVVAAAAVLALLLDAVILGASLKYVAGVKAGRPAGAWRGLAHAGIAGTLAANLAAAGSWGDAGWHVIAPAVWSAVVEFTARDILGDMREVRAVRPEVIPFRLWVTAPVESARTTFRMLRTGETAATSVRLDADRRRAAADALQLELATLKLNRRETWRIRRLAGRRLWAGTITPEDVFVAIGWTSEGLAGDWPRDAKEILRSVLSAVRRIDPDQTRSDRIESTSPIESIGSGVDRIGSGPDRIRSGADRVPGPIGSNPEPDRIESTGSGAVGPIESEPVVVTEEPEDHGPVRGGGAVVPIGSHRHEIPKAPTGKAAAARPEDVEKIRTAIARGELASPPRVTHVMEKLSIGPTYARAAVHEINGNGSHGHQLDQQGQAGKVNEGINEEAEESQQARSTVTIQGYTPLQQR